MRQIALLELGVIAVVAVSCAGYRLGPTNGESAGGRSVQVNFFQNKTPQPRLIEAVNSSLRRALQQDGTYKLATQGQADVIVNGILLRYDRPPLSFQPADILTVRDYRVSLVARITATERLTGRTVMDREVIGTTTIRAGADQTGAERQALPLLADDLARQAKGLLVDGAW